MPEPRKKKLKITPHDEFRWKKISKRLFNP